MLQLPAPQVQPGQPITLLAAVSAVPPGGGEISGSVWFFDGSVHIGTAALAGSGRGYQAALTVPSLGVGSHTLVAVYLGSGNHHPSASSPTVLVVEPYYAYLPLGLE